MALARSPKTIPRSDSTTEMRSATRERRSSPWRRELALEFTVNATRGRSADDLVALCRSLFGCGHLAVRDATSGRLVVREDGAATVSVALAPSAAHGAPLEGDAEPILRAAAARVVAALAGLRRTPQDDRFLHAAIYTRRVQRITHGDGEVTWEPRLAEGERLSDWVLALFAADALCDRTAYDHSLSVCNECSWVGFSELGAHTCP